MDLQAQQTALDATKSQLSNFPANYPSEIESQIQKAYTPALQESLGVTQNQMSDYLGRFMETTGMGPGMAGTTAKDLSPTQKMGVIGRELGSMGGQLNASVKYSDYLGAQMNDVASKATQAAQMGYQSLADQYNRDLQQYQMAWQEAEAEKDRALQRELARSSGGGGGTVINLGGGDTTPTPTVDRGAQFTQKVAKYKDLLKTKGLDSNFVYTQLWKEAQSLGLNISGDQLMKMLGSYSSTAPTKSVVNPTRYLDLTGGSYGGTSK